MSKTKLDPNEDELNDQTPEVPQEEGAEGIAKPEGDPVHPDPIKP